MQLWQSKNPAVAAVNAKLTAAGHDLTTRNANPLWYGKLHRQRAEQVAFALLPEKHHRDAIRLFAEHLFWLVTVPNRDNSVKDTGWHWRHDNHERLARALCCAATDTIKKATADLRKHGLIDSREAFIPQTFKKAVFYRLTDEAHVILALLNLAGAGDPKDSNGLNERQWLDLLSPTAPTAKPLRDVLAGWQGINTPEAVDAMLEALKAAVAHASSDASTMTRKFYETWRTTLKEIYPEADPGGFSAAQQKRIAPILKELNAAAGEPGAAFTYSADDVTAFAKRMVTDWHELSYRVKKATGKNMPDMPDLDRLSWHVPLAIKLAYSVDDLPVNDHAMDGW